MEINRKNKIQKKYSDQLKTNVAYLILDEGEEAILINTLDKVIILTNCSNERSLFITETNKKEFDIIGEIYNFDITNMNFRD